MKMSFLKRLALSLGYSSVVESLPRMREALDSIPSAENRDWPLSSIFWLPDLTLGSGYITSKTDGGERLGTG